MKKIIIWIKCLLKHDWLYCSEWPVNGVWNRECKRCSKRMHGTYDMSYGCTDWNDGWNHK